MYLRKRLAVEGEAFFEEHRETEEEGFRSLSEALSRLVEKGLEAHKQSGKV